MALTRTVSSARKSPICAKPSFREQVHLVREQSIIDAVNRLLCEQGYEAMTVDAVAAQVGVAKPSLYRHFASKEDLAAAAMVQVLRDARHFLAQLPAELAPVEKLKEAARWMMRRKLAGTMPHLPSQNSKLRSHLSQHKLFIQESLEVGEQLATWIDAAQKQGALNPQHPLELVLYTLYARACDPVLEFLRLNESSEDKIIEWVISTCFDGLSARAHP